MRVLTNNVWKWFAVLTLCASVVGLSTAAQQKASKRADAQKKTPAATSEQQQQQPVADGEYNPRPGQTGHRPHKEWQGAFPTLETAKDFKVVSVIKPPEGFIGNLAYDAATNRLWLISLGRPTNPKGSTLYEMDAATGKILAEAKMPLIGDFGDPVYIDGYLYQGVHYQSKMYKIAVNDKEEFGKIVKTIPLPTLNDLNLVDEAHPYPFIDFGGVGVTPDKNIIFHADDVGEFITIERETGEILSRVRTLKALGGIDTASGPHGELYVLANSDPRGGYCALSFPPAVSRTPEQKDISWALLDGKSGEVLASIRTQNSRAYASTLTLMKHEDVANKPYGRFTFFATGEEGLLLISWEPTKDAY
jgi:hypothetical protein